MEPVSCAAVEEDGTSGLVIEVFDDLDKVGADVVLLHGCPLCRHSVGSSQETSSHATRQGTLGHGRRSSAEPLLTDPGLKSRISARELISS